MYCLACRVVEALVSVRRLSEFLRCPESTGPTRMLPRGGCSSGSGSSAGSMATSPPTHAISLSGSFSWGGSGTSNSAGMSADSGGAALLVAELVVPFNALVAVTGPVGSGKSSLLAAVLGEMLPSDSHQQQMPSSAPGTGASTGCGYVAAGSSVAFVPQDPWIMHGSVRWAALCHIPHTP